jgi:hypothetical protein
LSWVWNGDAAVPLSALAVAAGMTAMLRTAAADRAAVDRRVRMGLLDEVDEMSRPSRRKV